jgi:uncharacterized protein (DUF4415 family)
VNSLRKFGIFIRPILLDPTAILKSVDDEVYKSRGLGHNDRNEICEQEPDMAVRRIGNTRLPDNPQNTWNVAAPNSISPGDILSGAPGYGGQTLREAPGPFIGEEAMVTRILDEEPSKKAKKPSVRGRKPKIRAVLPVDAKRVVELPSKESLARTAINLRVPVEVLKAYKTGGRGYQSRMIAVLELFLEEGGKFIEV